MLCKKCNDPHASYFANKQTEQENYFLYKLLKKLSVEFLLFLAKTLWFTLIEYVCSENIPLKF